MSNESTEIRVKNEVEKLIEDFEGLFIVHLELKGHTGNQKLVVLLDGDTGITIDECAQISRKLGFWLEENDVLTGKYILEVSSAGADQPLTLPRQYEKHIGRSLELITNDGNKLTGELLEILNGSGIKIREPKSGIEHQFSFEEINKSKVIVSFK